MTNKKPFEQLVCKSLSHDTAPFINVNHYYNGINTYEVWVKKICGTAGLHLVKSRKLTIFVIPVE
jgi:hypothetical protein